MGREKAGIALDGLHLRLLFNGDHEYAVVYSRLEFREEIWAVPAFCPFFSIVYLFLIIYRSYLYNTDTGPLLDIRIINIFHSMAYLFTL